MTGELIVVSDGFYGSCGKGHVAGMLQHPDRVGNRTIGIRVGGPNAGHIVYGNCPPNCEPDTEETGGAMGWGNEPRSDHWYDDRSGNSDARWLGHPWKLRQVPVASVTNSEALLMIAAGSEVNPVTLTEELEALDAAGYGASDRLSVDSSATLLEERHVQEEQTSDLRQRLGSTTKGIGAARADRIWRMAKTWGIGHQFSRVNTASIVRDLMSGGWTALIEGTQGYGLGLHSQNYPFTTAADCRAIDFLSQAGLSPWHQSVGEFTPWVVLRVRPIRVAGNSGPMKGETSWAALGLREERTTVTRKVRRVGEWDANLAREAIEANGGNAVKIALTMVDTVMPELALCDDKALLTAQTKSEMMQYVWQMEADLGRSIDWIGTGPATGIWV